MKKIMLLLIALLYAELSAESRVAKLYASLDTKKLQHHKVASLPKSGLTSAQERKVSNLYKKYKFEWDYIIPVENKALILDTYRRASKEGRGYLAASIHFIESRGSMDRLMTGVHVQRTGKVVIDCGAYGINTGTYADSIGDTKLTYSKAINYCYRLKHSNNLSYKLMMEVLDRAEQRLASKKLGSKQMFRHTANYYNTGRLKLVGSYWLKVVALTRLYREVL